MGFLRWTWKHEGDLLPFAESHSCVDCHGFGMDFWVPKCEGGMVFGSTLWKVFLAGVLANSRNYGSISNAIEL